MRQLKSAPGKVFEGSVSHVSKKEIRYLVIYVYMRSNGVSEKGVVPGETLKHFAKSTSHN